MIWETESKRVEFKEVSLLSASVGKNSLNFIKSGQNEHLSP